MTVFWIFVAILILMFMIAVHELGHYLAGKLLGFRINEFAIGFGKPLFQRQNKKTGEVFSIRMIPLGGYCAFAGEDDAGSGGTATGRDDESQEETKFPEATGQLFHETAPWKRLIVLFSGGFFNFICAIIFCIVMMMVFGPTQGMSVERVAVGGPNYRLQQGLRDGDVLTSINDERFTLMNGMHQVIRNQDVPVGEKIPVRFTAIRDGQEISLVGYITRVHELNERGEVIPNAYRNVIGIHIEDNGWRNGMIFLPVGLFQAIGHGFMFSLELVMLMLELLWALITGNLNFNEIGGTGAAVSVMAEAVSVSVTWILLLVPLISVNLAVFNLLPIPALDGARMVFVGIEWIRGKPVNPEIEGRIHMFGLLFLFAFVIFADLNFFIFSR